MGVLMRSLGTGLRGARGRLVYPSEIRPAARRSHQRDLHHEIRNTAYDVTTPMPRVLPLTCYESFAKSYARCCTLTVVCPNLDGCIAPLSGQTPTPDAYPRVRAA